MPTAKIPKARAEEFKIYLLEHNLLDHDSLILRKNDTVLFPVTKAFKPGILSSTIVTEKLPKRPTLERNLKKALEYYLTAEEVDQVQRGYDIVGTIIVIDIPDALTAKEGIIAEELMKIHKQVTTVLKKVGIHKGEFRTQPMEYLMGEDTRIADYRENGVHLTIDVERIHFSARTANERLRIAHQVQKGERVLIMFSGAGPYPTVIAQHSKAARIIGIEKNPIGHEFAVQNTKKYPTITLHEGDVRTIVPALQMSFDRIVMPLPKDAGDFLRLALSVLKPSGVLHIYAFSEDHKQTADDYVKSAEKLGYTLAIHSITVCGQFSPRLEKICVDLNRCV